MKSSFQRHIHFFDVRFLLFNEVPDDLTGVVLFPGEVGA